MPRILELVAAAILLAAVALGVAGVAVAGVSVDWAVGLWMLALAMIGPFVLVIAIGWPAWSLICCARSLWRQRDD